MAVRVGGAGEWNSAGNDDITNLLGRATLTFNAGSALGIDTTDATTAFTYSGNISGSEGLTKLGSHTLILNGANAYTGLTTVSGGTLQIGDGTNGSIAASSGVANSGLLEFNLSSGTTTFAGNITGSGTLTQMGGNVLCLAGSNSYTGPTTISVGTLQMGSSTGLASTTPVSISSSSSLEFRQLSATIGGPDRQRHGDRSRRQQHRDAHAGPGGRHNHLRRHDHQRRRPDRPDAQRHRHRGSITGSNTYSGPTTISAGTLQIGSGGTIGSINGTSGVADNGLLVFNLSSGTTNLSGNITGSGGLKQMGASMLCLAGSNTYSGSTAITAGTLQIGNGGATGSIDGTIAIGDSGLLSFNLSSGTTSVLAVISGNGGLAQLGPSLFGPYRQQHLHRADHDRQRRHVADRRRRHHRLDQQHQQRRRRRGTGLRSPRDSATFSKSVTGLGGLAAMGSGLLRCHRRQHLQRPDHDQRRHPPAWL